MMTNRFSLKIIDTVLLQWLIGALLKEGKPQTGQVRIALRVYHDLLNAEGQHRVKCWLSLSSSNCWPFPGLAKFLWLLPLFIMFPLRSRTSLPLPLCWLQKFPTRLQSQFHVPAPLRDLPDPRASKARSNCRNICLLRCLQCTNQSTFLHLMLLVYEFPEGRGHISYSSLYLCSWPDGMANSCSINIFQTSE